MRQHFLCFVVLLFYVTHAKSFTMFGKAVLLRGALQTRERADFSLFVHTSRGDPRRSRAHVEYHTKSIQRSLPPLTAVNFLIVLQGLLFLMNCFNANVNNALMKSNRAIRYYGQTYRLFTSLFVHANLYHVGMNVYSLSNIGPFVERSFGTARFLGTFFASGILANLVTYSTNTSPYSLGSSGCTFGLLGSLVAFLYRNKSTLGQSAETQLEYIKRNIVINLIYGLSSSGIDNGAHLYGFLAGFGLGYLKPKLQGRRLRGSDRRRARRNFYPRGNPILD
jgi:membrane associated rhomboid family serine protease